MAKSGIGRAGLNLVNRMVRPLDALAASPSDTEPAPLMIVGLPRSGTTLVYELIVQAFDTAFLTRLYSYLYGLPNTSTRLVAKGIRDPYSRYDSNYGRIAGRFAPAENAVFWKRWFKEHETLGHCVLSDSITNRAVQEARETIASMSSITQRSYVFKNVYMTLSVPAFLRLLPAARVVVVTRDLDATIASVYRGRQRQQGWWSIRPPFVDDVADASKLEQTVFQCVRSQQVLERSLATVERERYLKVDYADVCADPRAFINDVERWVGDDLRRRKHQQLPDRFERSAGPGIAVDDKAIVATRSAALHESKAEYLSRIASFSKETSVDGQS